MSDLTLEPLRQPFAARITPPGSKSLTNRALVLGALAAGPCEISNILVADDTAVMLDGLKRLGFALEADRAEGAADTGTLRIEGRAGTIPASRAELFCGNSGTTIRFLTAMCALGRGRYTLDGVPRMRQRPIGALTALLTTLGARITHEPGADGFPPVHVEAGGLRGGTIAYGSEVSSQYLSAVLMAAPCAAAGVRVELTGVQTSWPYVAMTLQLMARFGVTPALETDAATGAPRRIVVTPARYAPTRYAVEPDASNASYFLAAAAVNPGAKVTIEGLGNTSLQGDVGFASVLRRMGADVVIGTDFITVTGPAAITGIDVDLSGMPDMAQTLGVVGAFASGRTTIRGLRTLRVKETDRIDALSRELRKLGAGVDVEGDALTITPAPGRSAAIDTYDDHRMAMSFAVAGTRIPGVTIRDVECVGKTYPRFFADLKSVITSA
ncbi:MAG: 3-phosphoshikimate 1-carboxyvinyltransferase [Candidatus Rokubacteria bacterium]|nr:3-phosphoshikimate 1-carboxyvinyltransferase [Candidatus Rokubacteria bacterium]